MYLKNTEIQYDNVDLFINTSCEHMKPMKEWGHTIMKNPVGRTSPTHFAFTSNNMYDIEHINCVDTIEDFKNNYLVMQLYYQRKR
ncbi:MAG: hypothetical protein CM15mV25_0400 [uncultured marine virus]|nr:MAG: hypothetical protein CM15mV25_0400 [uncultured marine virus]